MKMLAVLMLSILSTGALVPSDNYDERLSVN